MRAHTIPGVIAAGALLATAALVLLFRNPGADLPSAAAPADLAPLHAPPAVTVAEPGPPASATPVEAKVRELEAMSETFRNTTFLIAIRDAGLVCHELLRVYGGVDESAKWMATCSEMLAYTVEVASNGTLHVEPFLQYFDGVAPRVLERDLEAPPQPEPLRR